MIDHCPTRGSPRALRRSETGGGRRVERDRERWREMEEESERVRERGKRDKRGKEKGQGYPSPGEETKRRRGQEEAKEEGGERGQRREWGAKPRSIVCQPRGRERQDKRTREEGFPPSLSLSLSPPPYSSPNAHGQPEKSQKAKSQERRKKS